ncbi:MAG TPA: Smr/MutS family protein [Polyangia bacterium]|nr:Smr/MutS family protein [Polyangia bacterium]
MTRSEEGAAAEAPELEARSQRFLDWPELLARLAGEARSQRGRAACETLALCSSAEEAALRMAEVAEIAALLHAGHALPGLAFPEVEPLLEAAEKGITLGADELRPLAELGEITGAVCRFFERPGAGAEQGPAAGAGKAPSAARGAPFDLAPLLTEVMSGLDPCRALVTRIRGTFDASGAVRDSVSPELARLRREREALSLRVRGEIEELMQSEEYAPSLQDRFWTMRGDRYVLPLRASAKSLGLGIVHDTSRTGETVFVEPTAVVALNNRLKLAELEIEREIRRILEELTREVARVVPALRVDLELLARLDVIAAKGRLGAAYGGESVAIVAEPAIALRRARHPLLTLRARREGFTVVDNDVVLDGRPAKVLVISGPNAGGKTVLLKTLGLAALLARAGMLVPAEAGGRVGFFSSVLADIGDQQSVLGDLSTFSAHLANLGEILRHDAGAATLVLLDEIMAGTNPDQGAALARAAVEALAERAGLAVITTHYDALKALAEGDGRFRNAGMEYDPERLRPTFRLRDGVPGRSYALDIATRMGLPEALLRRARELAGGVHLGLEQVIAALESRETDLARATEELAAARATLAERDEQQREAVEALERRERELGRHARAAIEEAAREAREAIRAIVREAQQAGSARAAEDARARLDSTARQALEKFPAPASALASSPPPTLQVGARVFVPSLSAEGRVLSPPDARGRLKVSVGSMTLDVDAAELSQAKVGGGRPAASKAGRSAPVGRSGPSATASATLQAAPPADLLAMTRPSPANTLDLRGHRADDAADEVTAYLDRAALEGRSPVFVIHGHGTGALRKVVRELVKNSPYVRRWAPGGKGQGGDGVTVIDLG